MQFFPAFSMSSHTGLPIREGGDRAANAPGMPMAAYEKVAALTLRTASRDEITLALSQSESAHDMDAAQNSPVDRKTAPEQLQREVEPHAQQRVDPEGAAEERPEGARLELLHVGADDEEAVAHEKARRKGEPDARPSATRSKE